MKYLSFLFLISCCAFMVAFTEIKPHTDVYKLNTDSSSMEWYAEKVTGKHNGTIRFSSGEFSNNHGSFTGNFVVDMTTIQNKDIESEEYKKKLDESGSFSKPIVTEISPFKEFYKAENYHQDYYNQNGEAPYCQLVIAPKLEKFKTVFSNKLKYK